MRSQVWIRVFAADGKLEREISCKRLPFVIGRDDSCDLSLDIDGCSRQHARLESRGRLLWFVDLRSRNGSYQIDGSRVTEIPLGKSTRLRIGARWIEVVILAEEAAAKSLNLTRTLAIPLPRLPTTYLRAVNSDDYSDERLNWFSSPAFAGFSALFLLGVRIALSLDPLMTSALHVTVTYLLCLLAALGTAGMAWLLARLFKRTAPFWRATRAAVSAYCMASALIPICDALQLIYPERWQTQGAATLLMYAPLTVLGFMLLQWALGAGRILTQTASALIALPLLLEIYTLFTLGAPKRTRAQDAPTPPVMTLTRAPESAFVDTRTFLSEMSVSMAATQPPYSHNRRNKK